MHGMASACSDRRGRLIDIAKLQALKDARWPHVGLLIWQRTWSWRCRLCQDNFS